MLNWARGRALATMGGCLAIAGCTALAGIQDGQLVVIDSGAGDGSLSDGPGSDGPIADGGMDGTTDGGGSDSSPSDGAGDSGSPAPVQCALKPNTTTLVDDLSTHPDAGQSGGLQFNGQVFAVPSTIGDGFYIVAQPGGQQEDFTLYAVDLVHHNTVTTGVLGADAGLTNVRLVDVNPSFSPPTAMFETALPGSAEPLNLSTVPLPASWNGSVGSPSSLATSVAIGGNANGGTLAGSPAAMDYLFTVQAQGGNTNTTYVGKSGTAMTFTLLTSSNGGSKGQFFDLGGQFFAVMNNLGDGGASQSTILAMNDNGGTPVQAPVPGPANSVFDGIIASHVSAVDSTKAAVFGVSIDTSGNATPWTGLFPPSKLTSLALGPQQFSAGQPLPISEIPFNGGGTTWGPSDQVFITGTPQSGANQILLIWWSATGRVIAHPSTSGPIVTRPNQILTTSIGITNAVAEVAASVFITWVEEVAPDGGQVYDQLWAAEATCFVVQGG